MTYFIIETYDPHRDDDEAEYVLIEANNALDACTAVARATRRRLKKPNGYTLRQKVFYRHEIKAHATHAFNEAFNKIEDPTWGEAPPPPPLDWKNPPSNPKIGDSYVP